MKNSEIGLIETLKECENVRNDPEWFKKALWASCFRDESGLVRNLEESELMLQKKIEERGPVVTTLRHIRSVIPDSISVMDDETTLKSNNINLDSCIILLRDEDSNFVEPISQLVIENGNDRGYAPDEIYNYSIGNDIFLVIGRDGRNVSPYAFVSKDALKIWKEETEPYKEELCDILNKMAEKTKENFGLFSLKNDDIISSTHSRK